MREHDTFGEGQRSQVGGAGYSILSIMLGNLDFVLKMMGEPLEDFRQRASQGLKITLAAAWSLGLKVGESEHP